MAPMKRKELEIILQRTPPIESPSARFEQYNTPPTLAADILFAAYMEGNIENMSVADLGTGSGILAIGASLLGAKEVLAYDVEDKMIEQAMLNAKTQEVENIQFITTDINSVWRAFDTVVMNPPFGAQKKHADLPFLKKALEIGRVVYTIHQSNTMDFLRERIPKFGGKIETESKANFPIPHTFPFHDKEIVHIDVTILKISKSSQI